MLKLTAFIILLIFLAGCPARVPEFSPRRLPTPEHKAAKTNQDCRGCHDVGPIRHHSAGDDCLNCHKLCKGCEG